MQKYIKEDRAISVNNLDCWPLNLDTIKFLSAIISASFAAELLKVY
jgi:hypothetical protein